MKSMMESSPSWSKIQTTLSLEKKSANRVLRISRDIRSLQGVIDSSLSKIKSARDRTLNLLEELEKIIDDTAAKEGISWNEANYLVTDADLKDLGIDQHGTNLPHPLETPVINLEYSPGVHSSPPTIQGPFTTQDLICSETMSALRPLKPGLTYLCGGTMVHLGAESQEEPLKNCQKLTEKMQELSGIMGTWDKESV